MIYMFLADGFEETEALVPLDLIRRAGCDIKTVGIGSEYITGAHGICVKADLAESQFSSILCDGIILPGGMPGTENLYSSNTVMNAVQSCIENKMVAAICAAPIILGREAMLRDKKAVCFPGFEDELIGAEIEQLPCVRDKNVITAKGAGCVFEFAYEIISYFKNKETADNVINTIQHKGF